MEEIQKKKIKRSALLRISLIAFVIYIVATLIGVQIQINEKRREMDRLQQEIMIEEITIADLRAELESGSDRYVEQIAREELDYAKPGERIFINVSGR